MFRLFQGIWFGWTLHIVLQSIVLPCETSCMKSYTRTAIRDIRSGGNWSQKMLESISDELSKKREAK